MKEASKSYKFELNKAYEVYQQNMGNKLRQKSKSDSKGFWKILNEIGAGKKNRKSDVSIDSLYEYFKEMNQTINAADDATDENAFVFNNLPNELYQLLNSPITENEILKSIRNLKNEKSSGIDDIFNEYIKNTAHVLMPLYLKMFNLVFDTGVVPELWSLGIIVPIYKNKGSVADPCNYRGITLNSCLGKTFSSILNERLTSFSDEIDLLSESQTGFRKGYSTVDNIFVLHSILSIYFSQGKKLFCTFVDFKRAFDTVWRAGLWQKLQKSNIIGKIFNVIYNMYKNIESCIKHEGEKSSFFNCNIGVRQGENLLPSFLLSS